MYSGPEVQTRTATCVTLAVGGNHVAHSEPSVPQCNIQLVAYARWNRPSHLEGWVWTCGRKRKSKVHHWRRTPFSSNRASLSE